MLAWSSTDSSFVSKGQNTHPISMYRAHAPETIAQVHLGVHMSPPEMNQARPGRDRSRPPTQDCGSGRGDPQAPSARRKRFSGSTSILPETDVRARGSDPPRALRSSPWAGVPTDPRDLPQHGVGLASGAVAGVARPVHALDELRSQRPDLRSASGHGVGIARGGGSPPGRGLRWSVARWFRAKSSPRPAPWS